MNEDLTNSAPIIKKLPSLLEFGQKLKESSNMNDSEKLFYTCPQCGHGMVAKKCKIVCYHCHYFIGCVE